MTKDAGAMCGMRHMFTVQNDLGLTLKGKEAGLLVAGQDASSNDDCIYAQLGLHQSERYLAFQIALSMQALTVSA